jgi:hypothetical protein
MEKGKKVGEKKHLTESQFASTSAFWTKAWRPD